MLCSTLIRLNSVFQVKLHQKVLDTKTGTEPHSVENLSA